MRRDPARQLRLLYGATLANFLASGLYFSAIPLFVSRELDGSETAVGLVMGCFSVSAIVIRPPIGRGIDRLGRWPFLVGALALLTLSGPAFFLVSIIPAAAAVRLLQGMAGGGFYTTAAAAATDLAPAEQRASAIAKFSLFLYTGIAVGPALGELLIDRWDFSSAWIVGGALGAVGLGLILLTGETAGDVIESARADPEPRPRRLLHPAAVGPGLVLATAGAGFASVVQFSALYAREIGMSSSGALYATFAVTVISVRVLSLRLIDAHSRTSIALPGLALASAGLGLVALVPEPAAAFVGVAGFGAGFALIFPALMAFTVDRVPERERGEVLGSYTAFMDLGAGLGGALVGRVADVAGFGWGYAVPAVLAACGFAGLAFIARREEPRQVGTSGVAAETPISG